MHATYPLLLTVSHNKYAEHSQYPNLPFVQDEGQLNRNGLRAVMINPTDAASRGIKDGDAVTIFNGNGAILGGAWVTNRIMPGTCKVWEGGWTTFQTPGQASLDLGGTGNLLCQLGYADQWSTALCANVALVQIQEYTGGA